jgi:hypothetical protein
VVDEGALKRAGHRAFVGAVAQGVGQRREGVARDAAGAADLVDLCLRLELAQAPQQRLGVGQGQRRDPRAQPLEIGQGHAHVGLRAHGQAKVAVAAGEAEQGVREQ